MNSASTDFWKQGFAYDLMRANRDAFFELLNALGPTERRRFRLNPEAQEFAELQSLTPHSDLALYSYITYMRAVPGYNRLLQQWYGNTIDAFRLNLACVLDGFATYPNRLQSAAQLWGKTMRHHHGRHFRTKARLWQLTNPTCGRGENAPKASALRMTSVEGFWLAEFLKVVGLFTVGMPLRVKEGVFRKLYVLRPVQKELAALDGMMREVRTKMSDASAAKLDIMVVLRLARMLVEHVQEAIKPNSDVALPAASRDALFQTGVYADGFESATYMDMGSVYAAMNVASIRIPPWFRSMTTVEEVQSVRALIDEHMRVIWSIEDERQEEGNEAVELLRRYREFLSGSDTGSFFDFAATYSVYALAKLHRRQKVRLLTIAGLETLMEHSNDKRTLAPIFENEGFQEIARAIRNSTVTVHLRKGTNPEYPYELRYGLGRDIRATGAYQADFLLVLSDFLTSYINENIRIQQRIRDGFLPDRREYWRSFPKEEYLEQIAQLCAEYGSELVCSLLVAYGHMVGSRRSSKQPSRTPPSDTAGEEPNAQET